MWKDISKDVETLLDSLIMFISLLIGITVKFWEHPEHSQHLPDATHRPSTVLSNSAYYVYLYIHSNWEAKYSRYLLSFIQLIIKTQRGLNNMFKTKARFEIGNWF